MTPEVDLGMTVRRKKRTRRERAVGKQYFDVGVVYVIDLPFDETRPPVCRVNWQAGRSTKVRASDLIIMGR